MTVFPEYQDSFARVSLKKGQLPFFISISTVQKIHLHHHDFVELSYVIEGSGSEIINGKKHLMQPGTCSFLLPHHMHEIESESGIQLIKYCCMFDINLLFGSSYDSELSGLIFRIGSELPSFANLTQPQAERMRSILEILHEEYLNPGAMGRSSLIRAKLTEAMLLFVRASHSFVQLSTDIVDPDEKINFWRILQYVHVHYPEKVTLEGLSRHFHVSAPYISRSFREHLGKSFLDYLHGLRIESAASMLISTNMTIVDIAVEVGFDSFRTFSRVFREIRKQTPSQYRNSYEKVTFNE